MSRTTIGLLCPYNRLSELVQPFSKRLLQSVSYFSPLPPSNYKSDFNKRKDQSQETDIWVTKLRLTVDVYFNSLLVFSQPSQQKLSQCLYKAYLKLSCPYKDLHAHRYNFVSLRLLSFCLHRRNANKARTGGGRYTLYVTNIIHLNSHGVHNVIIHFYAMYLSHVIIIDAYID